MKINVSIISIPPYISTTWDHVQALHLQEKDLVITLTGGEKVIIPSLAQETIDQIFEAHATYIETHKPKHPSPFKDLPLIQRKMGPFAFEGMMRLMQHTPEQHDLPPLNDEIAQKIALLAKIIPEEDLLAMPPSQPECNCMYCQIHRILLNQVRHKQGIIEISHEREQGEEEVTDSDLQFQEWDIKQIKEQLYTVTSRIDPTEQYTVFLGDPIGCTCGKTNCEHIIAVLRS